MVLAGAAAAVALLGEDAADRLRVVLPTSAGAVAAPARPAGELDPRVLRAACLLAGAAVLLLAPGAVGLTLAAVLALLGPRLVRRLQPPGWQVEDREAARDLPLALDLLASCLSGGAPLDRAVAAVAEAAPGACGRRLAKVARALAVGTPPAEAWQLLAGPAASSSGRGPGGDGLSSGPRGGPAAAAARALARAADGGAPVATTVARIAASARAVAAAEASRAARRAGVLAVGPLGLCFLPAFVLLGVVPAIVGLAGPLLSGL